MQASSVVRGASALAAARTAVGVPHKGLLRTRSLRMQTVFSDQLRRLTGGGETPLDSEGLPPLQKALTFSQRFDPPERERQKLPTSLFGMLTVHWKASIGIRQRIWAAAAKNLLKTHVDPTGFQLEDFLEGARFAYPVIRQVAANSRSSEDLHHIAPMLSPTLLKRLIENLDNKSSTDRNIHTRVHDVYAEVVELKLRLASEEKANEFMTLGDQRARGRTLIEEAEWLQIKVRYVAIEDDFLPNQQSDTSVVVDNTGVGGMSLTCEPRASTWVFEGKVWNMKPKEVEAEADSEDGYEGPLGERSRSEYDMVQAARERRLLNPELLWRLIDIRL